MGLIAIVSRHFHACPSRASPVVQACGSPEMGFGGLLLGTCRLWPSAKFMLSSIGADIILPLYEGLLQLSIAYLCARLFSLPSVISSPYPLFAWPLSKLSSDLLGSLDKQDVD